MIRVIRIFSFAALGLLAVSCSRREQAPEATPLPVAQSAAAARPAAQSTIEEDTFYNDLDPYGDWVELPDYGWSFAPAVDDDWRPYTRGQWENTDDGWYWDSDEDFGWATYHYGRWVDDRRYGWVWVPGNEWAPAWVSWRQGNGYTGWAPLPPRATWRTNVGLQLGGVELDALIGARDYNFVEDRYFLDRGMTRRVQPWKLNVEILNRTTNVTRYESVNDRVYNRGVALVEIERAAGRKAPERRTVDRDRHDIRGASRDGDVAVFRPRVKVGSGRRPSRGASVVKGEAPPVALVERGQRREREQPKGQPGDFSARDAAKGRPGADRTEPGRGEARTPPPPPNQERDRSAAQSEAQRARAQEQQRADNEKRQAQQGQADQRLREQQQWDQPQADRKRPERESQPPAEKRGRGAQGRGDTHANDQAAQQQREQAAQEAARAQAAKQQQDAEKVRADQQRQNQQPRERPQAEGERQKRQGPPGQADKAPKQDPHDRKAPPNEKRDPKGPKAKPTPGN